jgi:hypothetical protein
MSPRGLPVSPDTCTGVHPISNIYHLSDDLAEYQLSKLQSATQSAFPSALSQCRDGAFFV